MKEVFILKKVGDIEYLVINKKDVENDFQRSYGRIFQKLGIICKIKHIY